MAIALKGVSKFYGAAPALGPLSISFDSGQTHVLLGSSGSGKSTLLRLVAGIVSPDAGEVWVEGTRLTPETQPQIAERIGYVIQEGGLFPHLSAKQNVTLKSELLQKPRAAIEERVRELASLVLISDPLLERFPRELSGGERQRVSLMRALMLDPPVLLLDEPLGALDPIVRRSLQQELRSIFDRLRKTVVLVTHDVAEAAFFGHRVILFDRGHIVQRGSFRELVEKPAVSFVSEFISAQGNRAA